MIATESTLVIERTFTAPVEMIWRAWTDRDELLKWFCPSDFKVAFCELDPRVGGEWRSGMESPEGEKHIAHGRIVSMDPPRKLVMTHQWEKEDGGVKPETTITVEIVEQGNHSKMTFTQEGFWSIEARDMHNEGWSECFQNLEKSLG